MYVFLFTFNCILHKNVKNTKHASLRHNEITYNEKWWIPTVQNVFLENDKYSRKLKMILGIYDDEDQISRCGGLHKHSSLTGQFTHWMIKYPYAHMTPLLHHCDPVKVPLESF